MVLHDALLLIPFPSSASLGEGSVPIASVRVDGDPETAALLRTDLAAILGSEALTTDGGTVISLAIDPAIGSAEGYLLEVATMEWFFTHYGPTDPDDPRVAPLLGDVTGVAPAVVVTAEYDPLRDEGEAYADTLEAAGVPVDRTRYDGLVHGFIDMATMSPAAGAALDDLVRRVGALVHP